MNQRGPPPDDIHNHWIELGKAEPEPPQWIIPNVIPTGMTIFGAPPKAGKSTWTYAFAATAAGLQCDALPVWCRNPTKTGTVLVLGAEASAGEMKWTMRKGLGVEVPDDAPILVNSDAWEFQLDGAKDADGLSVGQRKLLEWLEYLQPVMTIVDPFRDYVSINENDSAEIIATLRPLRDWHKKNGAAMILVHHSSKRPYEGRNERLDPRDLRGSGALFGKADGCFMFTPKGDPNPVEVYAWFKRGATWCRLVQPAVYGVTEAREVFDQTTEKVMMAIQAGAPSINALCEAAGVSKAILGESLAMLKRNGYIGKDRDGMPVVLQQLKEKRR